MFKIPVKFFDFIASSILAGAFLLSTGMMIILPGFRKKKRRDIKEVTALYISNLDFRKSVLSTYREDMLLGGFIKRVYCYYFDFDRKTDENVYVGKNIYLNNMSVHPDNAFTRAGFKKTVGCVVVIKTFFTMLKTVREKGVNIIRAHDPHLLGFNAYLLSRLTRVPFVVQICSNYELKDRKAKGLAFSPFMFQTFERWFERAIMRGADMVMTDREHYRSFGLIPKDIPDEKYANIGFYVSKIHYTSPGAYCDLREELMIPREKKILLYVGRLAEVKYPLDLLKMFGQVLKSRKDVLLLLVGEGILKNDMKKKAEQNDFKGNILFLPKVPQDKIRDLYYTADLTCFTSAGFTMIEAALAERCIVAYDFEWHSEFIGKNERGMLVPFGDYHKFAEEVLGLLENPRLREKLGKTARSYALKHYSKKNSIEKELNLYRDIFEKQK